MLTLNQYYFHLLNNREQATIINEINVILPNNAHSMYILGTKNIGCTMTLMYNYLQNMRSKKEV